MISKPFTVSLSLIKEFIHRFAKAGQIVEVIIGILTVACQLDIHRTAVIHRFSFSYTSLNYYFRSLIIFVRFSRS